MLICEHLTLWVTERLFERKRVSFGSEFGGRACCFQCQFTLAAANSFLNWAGYPNISEILFGENNHARCFSKPEKELRQSEYKAMEERSE